MHSHARANAQLMHYIATMSITQSAITNPGDSLSNPRYVVRLFRRSNYSQYEAGMAEIDLVQSRIPASFVCVRVWVFAGAC